MGLGLTRRETTQQSHCEEEQALQVNYASGSSYNRGCGRGNFRGRGSGRGRESFDKTSIECFNCHKMGHFQWKCPDNTERKANFAEADEEVLLIAYVDNSKLKTLKCGTWTQGCCNHMTGNKCLFSNLNENFRENVKLGNNSSIRVMGKGNVQVLMNRKKENIGDVFYVPELKSNLISIGQLQEADYAIVIQKGSCHIYDSEKELIVEVKMSGNGMFPLLNEVVKDQPCLKSTI